MSELKQNTGMRPGAYEELWEAHKYYYGDESWARVDMKDMADKIQAQAKRIAELEALTAHLRKQLDEANARVKELGRRFKEHVLETVAYTVLRELLESRPMLMHVDRATEFNGKIQIDRVHTVSMRALREWYAAIEAVLGVKAEEK